MTRASKLDEMRTSFGSEKVSMDERRSRVTALFDRIAPHYDLMNDLMSFGLHRLWKSVMVRETLKVLARREGPLVDLAGGTGDIALAVKTADPLRHVIVADASSGMLAQARERGGERLGYIHAPAEDLPLEDGAAAAVTLAFGLRNMTDPTRALFEVARILPQGGALVLLEFSEPDRWFAPLYALHARFVIPALGALVARDKGAYQYLVESIEKFPNREDISRELALAGLQLVRERAFMFGIARLHIAVKP
ncbi:ubiquinone/menaquinone biosynthesis methyltransferase [Thioclava sp. A2]|uniref:ubiquinone/menaquinone biosynthesis methyltransferase n=1 Tax=Thioclava sp. FCG-A2 TaxID=3080562 RepID=UPI0029545E38|nr:ubiquinone/menaquinone biosynthesis methyltransferase [Thioclava sp. A2]